MYIHTAKVGQESTLRWSLDHASSSESRSTKSITFRDGRPGRDSRRNTMPSCRDGQLAIAETAAGRSTHVVIYPGLHFSLDLVLDLDDPALALLLARHRCVLRGLLRWSRWEPSQRYKASMYRQADSPGWMTRSASSRLRILYCSLSATSGIRVGLLTRKMKVICGRPGVSW